MQQLFKYLPSNRLSVIQDLQIRFTQLSSLNDPFEMYHSLDVTTPIENVMNGGIAEVNELWNRLSPEEKTLEKSDYLEAINSIELHCEGIINQAKLTRDLSNYLDNHLGILSLTEVFDSLLMWSHYANSSQGFVLGFHSGHPWLHKTTESGTVSEPMKVKYSTKRSKVGDFSSINDALAVKPIDWSYEKEHRLCIQFKGLKPLNDNGKPIKDEFGNEIYLVNFPSELVSSVYLGARISEQNKQAIFDALEINEINCPVYEGYFCSESFAMKFREIST